MAIPSAVIEALYQAFAGYPSRHVTGCPCCASPEELRRLTAVPLRSLSGNILGGYAMSAMYTVGSERNFKHFLPRLLQLVAEGDLWVDPQTIYSKLPYADWRRWPAEEQLAIERFTEAWFAAVIAGDAGHATAEDVLECAGLIGADLAHLLRQWEAAGSAAAASYLAELVNHRAAELARGALSWIWWRSDREQLVVRWLLSGSAAALLAAAVERDVDHPDASSWALAHDTLLLLSPGAAADAARR